VSIPPAGYSRRAHTLSHQQAGLRIFSQRKTLCIWGSLDLSAGHRALDVIITHPAAEQKRRVHGQLIVWKRARTCPGRPGSLLEDHRRLTKVHRLLHGPYGHSAALIALGKTKKTCGGKATRSRSVRLLGSVGEGQPSIPRRVDVVVPRRRSGRHDAVLSVDTWWQDGERAGPS